MIFERKKSYEQYQSWVHLFYNMIFDKSNHVSNTYSVITYSTIDNMIFEKKSNHMSNIYGVVLQYDF